jgi:molybdopterin-guanine dinucleotide biosynthesis protein A
MAFADGTGPPPAVILAGGGGRRMGGADKALLPLLGRPLLAHVAGRIAPQAGALALNANGDPARFARFGLPVLPDPVADAGPLAGVLAAMGWAAGQGAGAVVTVAVDTPFFPADLVAGLSAAGPFAIAADTDGRAHPVFGLWPVGLRDELAAALARGARRVGDWAEAEGAARAVFPAAAFLNVNVPEDLSRAEARLSGAPGDLT